MGTFSFTSENINGTQLFYLTASLPVDYYRLYFETFPNWPSEDGKTGSQTPKLYVNGKTAFTYSVIPYFSRHMRLKWGLATKVEGGMLSLSGVPYDFDVWVGEPDPDPPPKVINPTPTDAESRVSRYLDELTWELP